MSQRVAAMFSRSTIVILLILFALVALVPLVWLIAATLKGPKDFLSYTFFPPDLGRLTLANFHDLFIREQFAKYLVNSVFVTSATVVVQLFFSSLAGYALAKYEFPGKKVIMALMLGTLLIPGQVVMAPLYEQLYKLGLVDTHWGLIIPGAVSVFGIFLFRQSILQVPEELLQAARLDGCSEFRIYWDIVMPVSRPMIGAFCLIAFMGAWNNFLWPQIILHHDAAFTLPIKLNQMISIYTTEYGMLMAGTLVSILPVVALFLLLQKEFVAGLTAGAVKG